MAFLDVEMETYSGIEVAQKLKAKNPYIVIFIVTSYDKYLDDAMDLNVFRYIKKPLDKKRLKSVNDNVKKWKEIESQYDAEIERSIDHVGIYCGTNENGEQMWCHCSSSGGGVVFQATDIFKHYFRYYK